MKFLKDPESQVVTRRLAPDVRARFKAKIDEFDELRSELTKSGSDYAIEQRDLAAKTMGDTIETLQNALKYGVKTTIIDRITAETVQRMDQVMVELANFVQKVNEGEFDESELAEYGE